MQLIRLEISGFKSFCDKSHLTFAKDGISIVVGPNGCGKSNIVDAIRWTLGEQSAKHLRGNSMGDVIFNGSTERKAVGMAQVSLIFSNENAEKNNNKYADFAEIVVTRRLFRTGESQYQINNTNVRLLDVRELFMDTGIGGKAYSIIEQGRISQIVTSNSKDRRVIIDEAAGIVKFAAKRQSAERKLDQTRQNITRVEDILQELRVQEETLRGQVDKAEEYLETKGKIEHLTKCIEAKKWHKLSLQAEQFFLKKENDVESQSEIIQKIEKFEFESNQLKSELELEEKELEKLRLVITEQLDILAGEKTKLELAKQERLNLGQWELKGEIERQNINQQLEEKEVELEKSLEEVERLETEILQKKEQLQYLEELKQINDRRLESQKEELEEKKLEKIELITRISNYESQLKQIKERLFEINLKKDTLNKEFDDYLKLKNKLLQEEKQKEESLKNKKLEKEQLIKSISSTQSNFSSGEEKLIKLRNITREKSQELTKLESRYQSLLELHQSHEDFDDSTKVLLEYFKSNPDSVKKLGFIGILTDIIELPGELTPQILAFLDLHFNIFIFSEYALLSEVNDLLARLGVGQVRVYFLDLITNKKEDLASTPSSFLPLKSQIAALVDQSEISLGLIEQFYLSENSFDKIENTEFIGQIGLLDSNSSLVTKDKVFYIGKNKDKGQASARINRRRELTELEKTKSVLDSELEEDLKKLTKESEQLDWMKNSLEKLQLEMMNIELDILGEEKELKALIEKVESGQIAEVKYKNEIQLFEEEEFKLDQKTASLEKAIENDHLTKDELEESIEDANEEIEITQEQAALENEEFQLVRITIAELESEERSLEISRQKQKSELEKLKNDQVRIIEQEENFKQKIEQIELNLQEITTALPQKEESLAVSQNQLEELQKKVEEKKKQQTKISKELAGIKKELEAKREENHNIEIKLAQLGQDAKNIEQNLYENFSITPEEVLKLFAVEDFNPTKEAGQVTRFKKKLETMGNINLAARDEYDLVKKRLDFLDSQAADLQKSIDALEESIARVNRESRKRFRDTFKQVNQKFQEIFPLLFGGGEAKLELTDEANILETGIEIVAQPPGKKLQSISLLSGGEKALTAISLIFAVFMIKPSPFCLLDEVDAPLDEANVARFNKMVKRMSEHTQFIVITHNKKTMEIGDRLFGITMEEAGTSKVVSVNMEAEKLLDNLI